MKLIVAGGRDYHFTEEDRSFLDSLLGVSEIVSGACRAKDDSQPAQGADGWGEEWAKSHGLPVTRFYPDWSAHGRGAGPRRNTAMAEYADALAVFPGGRGTDSMRREAEKRGLTIHLPHALT